MSLPDVVLTNLDKVLWPRAGFRKGDMIEYYRRIAPALLPHLAGRPLVTHRSPDGVEGKGWFQTRCPHPPAWLRTATVPSGSRRGEAYEYCVVDDLRSLLWVANLGAIELHPLLACTDRLDVPTQVVFDLDPGPPAGIAACSEVAVRLRDLLAALGLRSVVKTSGWAGIHVVVPLNSSQTFEASKRFARSIAAHLAARHPELIVDRPAQRLRQGKVFIDWSQNSRTRSIVAPYSLRATDIPLVSTPLAWEEVGQKASFFQPQGVLERVAEYGDRFRAALEVEQELPPDWPPFPSSMQDEPGSLGLTR